MSTEIIAEFQNGTVKVSVNGVQGKSCTDITKKLEEALGVTTEDEKKKEFFERPKEATLANRA